MGRGWPLSVCPRFSQRYPPGPQCLVLMGGGQLKPRIKRSLTAVAFCVELHLHFVVYP